MKLNEQHNINVYSSTVTTVQYKHKTEEYRGTFGTFN